MLLWLAASTASAASLGRIVVHSAIGEPFRADIEILALQEGAASPALRLAAAETYALNQLQYPSALIGARIQFVRKASGANVAEVVGTRAVLEPYLQLMVEMDLDGVRIARTYTLLLDPPGSAAAQGAQMVAAPVATPEAAPAGVVTTARVAAPPAPAAVKAGAPSRVATVVNKAASKAVPLAAPVMPVMRAMPQAGAVMPAAMTVDAGPDRELKRLESLVIGDRKTIADMLERVAAMERTVAEMQRWLKSMPQPAAEIRGDKAAAVQPSLPAEKTGTGSAEMTAAPAAKDPTRPAAVPATPAPAPAVQAPAPVVQAPAAPSREQASAAAQVQVQERQRRSEDLSSIMLLVLGIGLVGMVVWLAYVMWGRPRLSKTGAAAPGAQAVSEPPAA